MMKLFKKPDIYLLLAIVVFSCLYSSAQDGMSYYMNNVPHNYLSNPASRPNCKYMAGLPVLSSFQLSMSNNALSLTDFISYNDEIKTPVTMFYSLEQQEAFLDNFSKNNYFNSSFNMSLGYVGFAVNDWFFIVDGNIKTYMHGSYPSEAFGLLLNGNVEHPDFNMAKMNLDATSMLETGVSVSRTINDKLRVGARPKILNGLFTFHTNNKSRLVSDVEQVKMKADMEARLALPNIEGLDVVTDENGIVDFNETSMNGDFTAGSMLKSAYSNFGLGIDLGAHYKITPEIEASVSITDLGFIGWKDKSYNYQVDGEYEFTGIDMNADTALSVKHYMEEMKESLDVNAENSSFTQGLRPKIFIGGHYYLPRGFDVGFVSKTSFYYRSVIESLTLFGKWEPNDGITLSLGYNLTKNNWSSFSMGLAYRLGFMNGFVLTESIPFRYDRMNLSDNGSPFDSLLLPVGLQNINIRFGFNILIGKIY